MQLELHFLGVSTRPIGSHFLRLLILLAVLCTSGNAQGTPHHDTVTGDASALIKAGVLEPLRPLHLSGGGGYEVTHYTWDSQNRLTGVSTPDSGAHAYSYDHRTRRVGVTSHTAEGAGTGTKRRAISFVGGLSAAEWEAENTPPDLSDAPVIEYTRGPDMGGGVGGLLYSLRREGGASVPVAKYNLSNGRGDIVAQSDQSATLTWTASCEAGGKRTKETGSNADKQRANSKDEDPTGLLHEGFRYRDLETMVWLSRDPAGFVDGPNLYAYVKSNPWSAFDPHGLDAAYVAYPDHPIMVPKGIARMLLKNNNGWSTDLGHAGVVLVNPESGKVDYYEFGRYDKEQQGLVRRNDRGEGPDSLKLPNVKFDDKGKPTKDSLKDVSKRLSEAIAGDHGNPERVELAYFSGSKKEYEKQKAAAEEALKNNSDPNRKKYVPTKYNCGDFARDTVNAGGETSLKDSDPRPKKEVVEHQKNGDSYTYTPSEGIKENEKKKKK